ncbi:hypothetical protein PCK1_002917 [Pneumocystis canis]|nr:hypothetical protein PCK1_002917 [Pneumocystis canis]
MFMNLTFEYRNLIGPINIEFVILDNMDFPNDSETSLEDIEPSFLENLDSFELEQLESEAINVCSQHLSRSQSKIQCKEQIDTEFQVHKEQESRSYDQAYIQDMTHADSIQKEIQLVSIKDSHYNSIHIDSSKTNEQNDIDQHNDIYLSNDINLPCNISLWNEYDKTKSYSGVFKIEKAQTVEAKIDISQGMIAELLSYTKRLELERDEFKELAQSKSRELVITQALLDKKQQLYLLIKKKTEEDLNEVLTENLVQKKELEETSQLIKQYEWRSEGGRRGAAWGRMRITVESCVFSEKIPKKIDNDKTSIIDSGKESIESVSSDALDLQNTDDSYAILQQVEFYFSDSNLPFDKFLWQTSQKNNGWVPIDVISTFKRMHRFRPIEAIVKALRTSQHLLEVDEDGKHVRRKIPLVKPGEDEKAAYIKRSVYVKGFGDETETSQIDIENFFKKYGKINVVRLRREDDGKFKGSVFCEFAELEIKEKFLKTEPKPQYNGKDLLIMSKQFTTSKFMESNDSGSSSIKP